jgi:hypothetical protein
MPLLNMKSLLTVVFAVLTAALLTGCNSSGSTGGQFAPNAKAEPGSAPVPAPAK